MKILALLLLVALVGAAILLEPERRSDALAISGCCKHRADTGGRWFFAHRDFQRCNEENRGEGDNVFEPLGRIWWDTRC